MAKSIVKQRPSIKSLKSAETFSTAVDIFKQLEKVADQKVVLIEEHDGKMSVMKSPLGSILPQPDFKMPTDDELETYAKAIGLPWDDEYVGRTLPFWASDERVDRHGDIVEQSWKFESYKTNPVLLDQHNWEAPPVGNCLNWQVISRTDGDYTGPALLMLALYATEEMNPCADTLFRLAKAKIIRTVSVGFYPGMMTWIQDPAERAEMGLGQYGYIYQNNELLELSMATIPANAGAYQLMLAAKSAGLLKAQDIAVIRESRRQQLLKQKSLKSGGSLANVQWRTADIAYSMFWKCLFPEVKIETSKDIEEPLDVLNMIEDIMSAEKKGKSKDNPNDVIEPDHPTDEDADGGNVSVMDALGAMTHMLVNVHDKLSDHSNSLESAHDKLDSMKKKVDAVHEAVTNPEDQTDEDEPPAKKPKKSMTPMELLLAAGSV